MMRLSIPPGERKPKRVLFLCKKRHGSGGHGTSGYGLFHSAKLVAQALNDHGHFAFVVQVNDNNDINREVAGYQPDIVVIEALWVVPEKFDQLRGLHPGVHWVVRLHSQTPFLAHEGIATEWIHGYLKRSITVAANHPALIKDFHHVYRVGDLIYLPNIYSCTSAVDPKQWADSLPNDIDIGCFGAIRPLKNQLKQALAAIQFADQNSLRLYFHMNATRCEQGGEPVLKNIRNLFEHTSHKLVEWPWMPITEFHSLASVMDIGMQVSLSETFNLVTADMVSAGVPCVVSDQVRWARWHCLGPVASPNDIESIIDSLGACYCWPQFVNRLQRRGLTNHNLKALRVWEKFLR